MKKMNKKGFAFSELLMVTVVIISVFMIIYTNIFPIMGELESRQNYNDLSADYVAFYLRKALINEDLSDLLGTANYKVLYPFQGEKKFLDKYSEFLSKSKVEQVILTNDVIDNLKNDVTSESDLLNLYDYIDYLPTYNNLKDDFEQYRLIVKTETGYATTLIKFSKDDYKYLFEFNGEDNIISVSSTFPSELETIYIPDFVNGIELNVDSWNKMTNLNSLYLNIFKGSTNEYIDGSTSIFGLPEERNFKLYVYDCASGNEDVIKGDLGIVDNNIDIICLQNNASEGVE